MSKSNGEIVAEVLLGGGALFALLALLNVVVWAVTGRGTLIDALIGPAVVVGLLVFMVLALGLGSERYPAPSRDDTPDRPPPATAPEAHTHLLAERVTVTERLYVLGALPTTQLARRPSCIVAARPRPALALDEEGEYYDQVSVSDELEVDAWRNSAAGRSWARYCANADEDGWCDDDDEG